jgi:hypothetical protein
MIERTFDYRRILRLVPWSPVISRKFYYLIAKGKGKDLGLWSFQPDRDGLRIHADLGPECRGKDAVESARAAFKWIFENTVNKIIYAGIPEENKPACLVASRAGMKFIRNENGRRKYEVNHEFCS